MLILPSGRGIEISSASGALSFDGRGYLHEQMLSRAGLLDLTLFNARTIKTLTRHPRVGNFRWYNPLGSIRLINVEGKEGVINAMGLPNPGIEWWCQNIGPKIDSKVLPLIGSIFGTPIELVEMAKMLNFFDLVALEINDSCPNVKGNSLEDAEMTIRKCWTVKKVTRFPVILKLSVIHDIKKIVKGVEGAVTAFSINSVPWHVVFPTNGSPFSHFGVDGGASGQIAQPFTWDFAMRLMEISSVPVIWPSVWELEDVERARELGAENFAIGSLFTRHLFRVEKVAEKIKSGEI